MQHLHPVSSNEQKCSILLFSLLSFSSKEKEGSPAHKFAGGKGEDNGVDQASFKEVSPYRKANDRKAKLPKFGQLVLFFEVIFLERPCFVWKTCARRNQLVVSCALTLF